MLIRQATAADLDDLLAVDSAAWPAALQTGREAFRGRLESFPGGQWIAAVGGKLVGWVCCQRITEDTLCRPNPRYAELTDHGSFRTSHVPGGNVFQLVGVAALPAYASLRVGRTLVDHAVELARGDRSVTRIVGFTRPAGYRRYTSIPMEVYLDPHREEGPPPDPVVGFHTRGGAMMVSAHAEFRPEDRDAGGYGVLIEYPLVPRPQ